MKALIKRLNDYEEKSKKYWQKRNELDKEHGRYRSPLKKGITFLVRWILTIVMIHALVPVIAGFYLLYSNDSLMDRNNFHERFGNALSESRECDDMEYYGKIDEARDCFVDKMAKEDFFLSGYVAAMKSARHAKDHGYPELRKAALAKIERLEDFHIYEDSRIDLEVQRAFGMVSRSWLVVAYQYVTGEDLFDASFTAEHNMELINDLRDDITSQ